VIGILGSGFGLYGYLPAVIEQRIDTVSLLESAKIKLISREELKSYENQIVWFESRDQMLEICDAVILSLPPNEQYRLVKSILKSSKYKIKIIFLEKPLAPSFNEAIDLLNDLNSSSIQYRIAYTFPFCTWFHTLQNYIERNCFENFHINIEWLFKAHFLSNQIDSWKSNDSEGGGVLNFYGIHIIAIFAYLGFNKVKESIIYRNSKCRMLVWEATYANNLGAQISILIDCQSPDSQFKIYDKRPYVNETIVDLNTPFDDEQKMGIQDNRVSGLINYLLTINLKYDCFSFYKSVNQLWKETSLKSSNKLL